LQFIQFKSIAKIFEQTTMNGVFKMSLTQYLNHSKTILDKFSHIQIEYHHGFRDLKKHLVDANFVVSHTNPKYENGMEIGWIYATKS